VGAVVDRSPGPDGLPRTRPLETPGDLTVAVKGQIKNVDRSPRKRVQFSFDLQTPAKLPLSGHYRLGVRQGSIIPADAASAKALGVSFVEPAEVWRRSARHAVEVWEREHGEAPDLSLWPANLLAASGLEEPAPEAGEHKGEQHGAHGGAPAGEPAPAAPGGGAA
jgi:hypothetical protein